MRNLIILSASILGTSLLGSAASQASSIDWDQIEGVEIEAFYPGVSPMEWVLGDVRIDRVRHGGGRAFRQGDTCAECHADETRQMGELIASGEKLEPDPAPGRPGAITTRLQAAHDGEYFHLRFSWRQPAAAGTARMDDANPVKVAFMLDAGQVDMADRSGCWASCHGDSRSMPEADVDRSKYVKDGSLANGIFYDLLQWRSGDGSAHDGYVADRRVLEPSTRIEAHGEQLGDTWTVTFKRSLRGGEGDVHLESGQVYNFGFAIHNEHSAGRFHHVSLGYRLGIDVEADITARRLR